MKRSMKGRRFPQIEAVSRCFWTTGAGAVQGQKAQIVQSCKTLDDFLPGFWLPPVRWANTHKGAAEAVEVLARLVAIERALTALARFENQDRDAP